MKSLLQKLKRIVWFFTEARREREPRGNTACRATGLRLVYNTSRREWKRQVARNTNIKNVKGKGFQKQSFLSNFTKSCEWATKFLQICKNVSVKIIRILFLSLNSVFNSIIVFTKAYRFRLNTTYSHINKYTVFYKN